MSSAMTIRLDEDDEIEAAPWAAFCAGRSITYSPHTVGRNVFYAGDVEVTFGEADLSPLPSLPGGALDFASARPPASAQGVRFSTYYGGSAIPEVAALALAFWLRFGGAMSGDDECRQALARAGAQVRGCTP